MPCGTEGLPSGTPNGLPDPCIVKDRETLRSGVVQQLPAGAKGLDGSGVSHIPEEHVSTGVTDLGPLSLS